MLCDGGNLVAMVLALYGVLALVTLQYTVLGLYVSSTARSIDAALRTTYGMILVLVIVTLAPYQVLQGKPWHEVVVVAGCSAPCPLCRQ